MENSSQPWDAYCALTACHLVELDKHLVVRPVVIGETVHRDLAKLVLRTTVTNTRWCAETFISLLASRPEYRFHTRCQALVEREGGGSDR